MKRLLWLVVVSVSVSGVLAPASAFAAIKSNSGKSTDSAKTETPPLNQRKRHVSAGGTTHKERRTHKRAAVKKQQQAGSSQGSQGSSQAASPAAK